MPRKEGPIQHIAKLTIHSKKKKNISLIIMKKNYIYIYMNYRLRCERQQFTIQFLR